MSTPPEDQVAWMRTAFYEMSQLFLKLSSQSPPSVSTSSTPLSPAAPANSNTTAQPVVSANSQSNLASGVGQVTGAVPLSDFLTGVTKLTPQNRLTVVDAAIAMLSGVFVHLPLKKSMHGIDPVQKLKLLKFRLEDEIASQTVTVDDRGFHDEMIEIFHSLRDLHTNYILPSTYRGKTAFLPFLVEEYFDSNVPRQRHYIVTKVRGTQAPDFKVGVRITHWNGIPIARAVEINSAKEAGSNPDARHARGLEALTLRPMALTAPPDEAWVLIGYESEGQQREIRFTWQVVEPPQLATAASVHDSTAEFGDAALVLGYDAETEEVRRARKSIFDDAAMTREQVMSDILNEVEAATLATETLGAAPPLETMAEQLESVSSQKIKHKMRSSKDAEEMMKEAARRFTSRPESQRRSQSQRSPATLEASSTEEGLAQGDAGAPPTTGDNEIPSVLPDFFSARKLTTPLGDFGYIRIYSFMAYDANAFVAEFARLAQALPQDRLIIDVRKNGGGNIIAGEKVLQILSPNRIEVERFHFINTPATVKLCSNAGLNLNQWLSSVKMSIATGEIYSQGFQLTQFGSNEIAYRYPGKKLLIIDALCYSTTDIFAAGFQDNQLGLILGTAGRTGAGGANVWGYELFHSLPGFIPLPLPAGVSFRTAVRRSTRVGAMVGVPLEDLGVQPDERHFLTLRDVTQGNVDLLNRATQLLQ